MDTLRYLQLGASLYVPASMTSISDIGNRQKYPYLRSVVFCTEDSLRHEEVESALTNLQLQLAQISPANGLLRYVRPRNLETLQQILEFPVNSLDAISGFVLPKITIDNFRNYWRMLNDPRFQHFDILPTLETKEVFDVQHMQQLRDLFLTLPNCQPRILSLRVGGNDLLNTLGVRRNPKTTIYNTPLSYVISMLVSVFRPYGFNLTGPVSESLQSLEQLRREVPLDLDHGLFGKTAVYPEQVQVIEDFYKVSEEDFEMAQAITHPNAPAVFRLHGAMCEPATHRTWAEVILSRAKIYGLRIK